MTDFEFKQLGEQVVTAGTLTDEAYALVLALSSELTPEGLEKGYARVAALRAQSASLSRRYFIEHTRRTDEFLAFDARYEAQRVGLGVMGKLQAA